MSNAPVANKLKFSAVISTPTYIGLINRTLGDPNRAKRFIASITSAVAVNPALQDCTPNTILAGALLGESLNLSPSPQLGQFYLVPFKSQLKDQNGKKLYATDENGNILKDDKGKWIPITESNAQFVLGYKGYIQLALRTGQYRRLNVVAVKEGELISYNAFSEELVCNWIEDEERRASLKTVGYAARFEYMNGFEKVLYWSKEKMLAHADRYSAAFSKEATNGKYPKVSFADYEAGKYNKDDEWLYSSFWYKDFDGMAMKTMLRQIISKWGIMSSEIETAFEKDASIANISNGGEIFTTPTDNEKTEQIIQQDEPSETPQALEVKEEITLDDI